MSLECLRWVFGQSPERGPRKAVLTVYAWHAGPDGASAYPSVDTICREAGLSERTVQRAIAALLANGAIAETGVGPNGTREVSVVMASTLRQSDTPPSERPPRHADTSVTEAAEPRRSDTQTVLNRPWKGTDLRCLPVAGEAGNDGVEALAAVLAVLRPVADERKCRLPLGKLREGAAAATAHNVDAVAIAEGLAQDVRSGRVKVDSSLAGLFASRCRDPEAFGYHRQAPSEAPNVWPSKPGPQRDAFIAAVLDAVPCASKHDVLNAVSLAERHGDGVTPDQAVELTRGHVGQLTLGERTFRRAA